jgi:glycerol-3-phosphate dehydrogenase
MKTFSTLNREEYLDVLRNTTYDLLVIGGGITGAGIALDAASRGLRTALVEKNDFASGTSSRSTKLIHGGLRYLKQLEFGLVKEVGSERAVVHNLAPHLVIPEKMLLPLSEKRGLGYWLTSIGLKIYDLLAGVKPQDQRRMLTRPQTLRAEPLLRTDDIKGGAIYAEYRTDDARLTLETIKTAIHHGADVLNYLKVEEFLYASDVIHGVRVADQRSGEVFTIRAQVVVSAAGPWVDELREVNRSRFGKRLHLTKGVHIVVPREKLAVTQAIYFDVDDGRMIFAIPRGRTTYIGTTDTTYLDSKEEVGATMEDATYLVNAVNTTFPSVQLTVADIESSWAGLRPLIHEDGKSASELSRKDEIFESPTGLISIAGGKLTGYRKMAERVVNLVIQKHFEDRQLRPCFTQTLRLAGAFATYAEVEPFIESVRRRLYDQREAMARSLVERYGRQTDDILTLAEEIKDEPALALLRAELQFGVQHELVVSLADFFVRRTGMLYFDIPRLRQWKSAAAAIMQEMLDWDDDRKAAELKQLDDLVLMATTFNP